MKIGIITWFKFENYGTKLQAFALQKYLSDLGNECYMIDFDVDSIKNHIRQNKKEKINILIDDYLYRIIRKINFKKFNNKSLKMEKFTIDNSNITSFLSNEDDFINECNKMDMIFIGSDQIWNPAWYHKYYYADYEKINVPKISYAASMGSSNMIPYLKEEIKSSLNQINSISVREEKAKQLIQSLTNKNVEVVCDPTLLLGKEKWDLLSSNPLINNKYLLCYFLTDNKNHWNAAKKFAKENNLELIIIPQRSFSYFQTKKNNIMTECGIEEFLGLIKNAEYIITDSFHGTVFSIIFNKNFTAIERHDSQKQNCQNDRISNLLNILGIRDCFIKYNSDEVEKYNLIDYRSVNNKLNDYVLSSKNFIKESLKIKK